eukprot:CFRG7848T1
MAQYYGLLMSAVGVASSCKPVLQFYKSAQALPVDGFVLWKQLETLQTGLEVCSYLSARQQTRPLVLPAIALCRMCLKQCELFLERDNDDESDERPDSEESWTKWFAKHKNGVTRQAQVKDLTIFVAQCTQSINLAISSANTLFPNHLQSPIGKTTTPEGVGYSEAYSLLQDREFGRWEGTDKVVCAGNLYEFAIPSAVNLPTWSHKGRCIVVLRVSSDTDLVSFHFKREGEFDLNYEDVDYDDGQIENNKYDWTPNATSTFELLSFNEMASVLDDKNKMMRFYTMSSPSCESASLGLEFESADSGVSIEVFEALVSLLQQCDAGALSLAEMEQTSCDVNIGPERIKKEAVLHTARIPNLEPKEDDGKDSLVHKLDETTLSD